MTGRAWRVRGSVAVFAALVTVACASTPAPAPAPAPSTPQVVTDPRVSEMRILVLELVDRMEVMQSRLNRMEDTLSELSAIQEATPSRPSPSRANRATADTAQAVERYATAEKAADLYQKGLLLFGRGEIGQARETFSSVYQSDPLGELADNALYWIAETHFVMNQMTEAISIYDRIVDSFPSQNKAPDALHKKALALVKLGDLSLARRTLETLIDAYPYSTAASAARLELERIRY